jgi:hypothetical protein
MKALLKFLPLLAVFAAALSTTAPVARDNKRRIV